ncbi:hypothetical protein [Myxosarcina sp. GI1]|uniref:hypothetical protein n=1 Tax=Myxosarcina sp. GI1 TaxID=1541065 RepID=UPI0005654ABD|nr:hypothetical protein [Myxosarcina sp. GI1]
MGRKAAPKCVYCARNYITEEEAQVKHPECYVTTNRLCYYKRYRLRNKSRVNAKRRASAARAKGIETPESVLPEAYRAELEIYGKENQFVHAIALKIYQGNKLTHQMSPQHTQGLRQPELEAYISKLLDYLETEYAIDCFGLIYWLNPEECSECREN